MHDADYCAHRGGSATPGDCCNVMRTHMYAAMQAFSRMHSLCIIVQAGQRERSAQRPPSVHWRAGDEVNRHEGDEGWFKSSPSD